jgi:son of sevenless-like protein
MEILSGLQLSSIYRLRQTWAGLSGKQMSVFDELKELMSRQGNFSVLRKHLKTCNPPIIPYLGKISEKY